MYDYIKTIIPEERILFHEPMSKHTTFRVGGEADCLIMIHEEQELTKLIRYLNQIEEAYFIVGNGSNLLVGDKGYRGVVLKFDGPMGEVQTKGTVIRAGAGALLSKVAAQAKEHGLCGMEFAAGIPGSIGGAVVMNAGAYGGEIKDCIVSARVMDSAGNESILSREQLELGYRTSVIQSRGDLVLEAEFQFEPGDPREIRERMKELNAKRRDKQPLEFASAGSTFKRPEGHFAGKLIEDAGLRGYRIGDAQVSEKHCGFVVNRGHATAKEVLAVICDVQKKVLESSGVKLEPEVKIIR